LSHQRQCRAGRDGLVAPRLVGANSCGAWEINTAGWKPALPDPPRMVGGVTPSNIAGHA